MDIFLKGLIIGIAVAAPVGPIGVLCIRRTLAFGRIQGFVSGLGAATADAIYGAIAAFGITSISSILIGQQATIQVIGGLFLLYLGVSTFRSRPAAENLETQQSSKLGSYLSTFFLTLTNPATIVSFAAIFAAFGLASDDNDARSAATMVAGVFTGSALWWLILAGTTGFARNWLHGERILWVNRSAGAIIILFGIVAILSAAQYVVL
jgi:threonine/homoserine/homoserine lactone efflux protein